MIILQLILNWFVVSKMGKKVYVSAILFDYVRYSVYRPHCMLEYEADWDAAGGGGGGRGLNFYNNEYWSKILSRDNSLERMLLECDAWTYFFTLVIMNC